jgi:hypothetical protein
MQKAIIPYFFVLLVVLITPNANGNSRYLRNYLPIGRKTLQQKDSTNWIDNFRQFRDAVYQADKFKVKSFIDFPMINSDNNIWYLVYMDNEKLEKTLTNKTKPFTEQDFEKYFTKVFSKRFINCILKIKTDELYKTGKYQTVEFNPDSATSYLMYATFDKTGNTLTLNLSSNTIRKDSNGETLDGGEFSINYYFRITKSGQIKFVLLRLAG